MWPTPPTPLIGDNMHHEQAQLVALLKKKGTGKTMSKSLTKDELMKLSDYLISPHPNITTKACIITAFLMLPNTSDEQHWFDDLKKRYHTLPSDLHGLFTRIASSSFEKSIHHIIHHNDLSYDEFKKELSELFNPNMPDHLLGIFLEAERLKRESMDENLAAYDLFWDKSSHTIVNHPFIVDVSVGYDGFNRHLCLWPFVAPILASLGVPVLLHGTDGIGPKKGCHAVHILRALNKHHTDTPEEAAHTLNDSTIAWGYIDQNHSFPELAKKKPLRETMVKRPIISTIEKCLSPLHGKEKRIIVTSYTHPPYKEKMITLLTHNKRWDKALLLRGQEGSIQLPLDRRAPYTFITQDEKQSDYLRPPKDLFMSEKTALLNDVSITEIITLSAEQGYQALQGKDTIARNILIYLSAVILRFTTQHLDPERAVQDAIDSKRALAHFDQYPNIH